MVQADQGLYDSLHHSAAVVGLNTSAMIEAAIVGRPVFTIADPEFSGGQQGTLHFWYLLEEHGGVVTMATNFREHFAQLAAGLDNPAAVAEISRRFVSAFVRPHGLDKPAAPIMATAVEQTGALRKSPQSTPPWKYPARWALIAAARRRGG
jgi:hypothetical protein